MLLNFEDLVEKAKVDLDLSKDKLIESSSNTGIDLIFYAEQRKQWVDQRSVQENNLERLRRLLWLYYSGKANAKQIELLDKKKPFQLQLNTKQDIEQFITSDTLYLEKKTLLDQMDSTIKFLDEVIGAVRFRAQVVRNIIQEKNSLYVE